MIPIDRRHGMTETDAGSPFEDSTMPRVLIAEDDVAIRGLLSAALRRRRLDVDLAHDGAQALAALQRERWAVVVLDLMMPYVTGWDVIRWLHEHPERKPKSVIVLSAADRDALRQVDPTVVNAIIFKPFNVLQVGAYVSSAAQHDGPDRRHGRMVSSL